jgi:SAM-dependent methyltransferase
MRLPAAILGWMGRFASTVEFYTRYREPYPEKFFRAIAERLQLGGDESLLDIGCGPGSLAIGFAPFVAVCTVVDPEPGMIEAARGAAEDAGVRLSLRLGRMEDFPPGESFHLVTIGRALHWLDRERALEVLERIVSATGRILICRSTSVETPAAPWLKPYQEVCRSWSDDPDRRRYRVKPAEWFQGSRFHEVERISVTETNSIRVDDLIGRALSKSNTSPALLGNRQADFEAAVRRAIEPFSKDGALHEEIVAEAAVYGRPESTGKP